MQDTQVYSHTSLFRRKYKASRRPRSRPTSRKASSISFREADFRTNYLQLVAGFLRGISKKKKVTATGAFNLHSAYPGPMRHICHLYQRSPSISIVEIGITGHQCHPDQKAKSPTFCGVTIFAGPRTTSPFAPMVNLPRRPASKLSPSLPVILPWAKAWAA